MSRWLRNRSPGGARRGGRFTTLTVVALALLVGPVEWSSGAATVAPRIAAAQQPAPRRRAHGDSLVVTAKEYLGWKYFHVYCYRCHGTDAFGGQLAPDLRHSLGPLGSITHDLFVTTVKEGRPTKGMPTWKALLTDEQIEGLYAYIKARSDGRLAPGRPHVGLQVSK